MTRRIAFLLLLVAAAAPEVRADELVFASGDRFVGKLLSLEGGKIAFESPLVGKLEIPAATLERLVTAEPIEIHLADGSVFRDRVVAGEPGELRTRGDARVGPQSLRLSDLAAINPSPETPPDWKGDFTIAAKAERGNSIKDEAEVDLKAVRETEQNRVRFEASYDGERNTDVRTHEGSTSDRRIEGDLKYDEFFAEPWYWYTRSKATRDGIQTLDLRFGAGGGFGYRWFKTERTSLDLELGLFWISEHYKDSSRDDDYSGLLFSWYLDHGLSDRIRLFSQLDWLIDAGEWDNRWYADLDVGLRRHVTPRFFVEMKIEWEYFTKASGDVERQDTDYILGLGYQF